MHTLMHKLVVVLAFCCLLLNKPVSAAPEKLNTSLPVFIENIGQITDQHFQTRNDIDFKIKYRGLNIFVGKGQIHYQWQKSEKEENKITIYRLDVQLVGANNNAQLVKSQHNTYSETFYTDQLEGVSARSFTKATYKDIYPNIDWVIYFKNGDLKHEFVLHEGADVEDIKLEYNGATDLSIENGALIARTPFGSLHEHAPFTYENFTGEELSSEYKLNGNTISFKVYTELKYNYTIDPTLEWATYFGGSGIDNGYALSTDTSDNIYMAGATESNNIATNNAHQTSLSGSQDACVVKYNPAGVKQWATYYGGAGDEIFFSMTRNSDNDFIIAGVTDTSYNLATNSSHQSIHGGGGSDCFIVKMNAAGQRLWATYYGGEDIEQQSDEYQLNVICDPSDNIYMVGNTKSDTGIATSGTAQASRSAKFDGFVVKFNKNGVRQWGSYYGGSDDDNFRKVVYDGGYIYITGVFKSGGLGTSGTHQTNIASNSFSDVLLAKFNATNGTRIWATYYGGSNDETSQGLGIDANKNIVVSGSTRSSSGIATVGAFQPSISIANGYDAFVAKFDSSGSRLWGTYYGGQATDHSADLIIDDADNIIFTGSTGSSTSIATPNSHQPTLGSSGSQFDAFLAIFTPTGSRQWASYYGGEDNDYGFSIIGQATGHMYICGHTDSDTLIAYSGSQNTRGGNNDAFLAKFTPDTSVFIFQPFTQTVHCTEDTFSLNYGVTSPFYSNNVFTVLLSDDTGGFSNPTVIGTVNGSTAGLINCTIPANLTGNGFRIKIAASNPIDTSYDNGNNITIKPTPTKPTASSNSPVCSNDTLALSSTLSLSGSTYLWTGPSGYYQFGLYPKRTSLQASYSGNYVVTAILNGCSRSDTTNVTILDAGPKPIAGSNGPLCEGDTLQLTAANTTAGATFSWQGPNSFTTSQINPQINNVQIINGGTYIFSVMLNGCTNKDTVNVIVSAIPDTISATSNSPVCSNDSLKLFSTLSDPGVSYSWQGPGSYNVNGRNVIRTNLSTTLSGNYIITAGINGCFQKDTVNVSIVQAPAKPNASNNSPLCSGDNIEVYGSNITSGSSVSWSGPGSWSSNIDTAIRANASTSDSGDYIITATLNGCTASDTTNVVVDQTTNLNITINVAEGTIVCPTSDLNFSITPTPSTATTYTWTGPNSWSDNVANAKKTNANYADSGYYYVSVRSGLCASGNDSIYVKVVDTISKPTIITNSPVCEGDTLTYEFTHPSIGIQGVWTTPNGNDTARKITIHKSSLANSGTYSVKVSSAGCTAADTTTVTIKPTPSKPSISSNSPVCNEGTLQLNGSNSTPGVSYYWEGPSGFTSNNSNPAISNISLNNQAGYYRAKSILNGCESDYDSTMVVITPNPTPEITTNSPVCELGVITLTVKDSSGKTHTWRSMQSSFIATGSTATISSAQKSDAGRYIVTAKDNNTGCIGEDTTTIAIIPLPGKPSLNNNSPICEKEDLILNLEDSSTNVSYSWSGPNSFLSSQKNTSRNNVQIIDSGYYRVIINRLGCTITDSTYVSIKPLPPIPDITSNSPLDIGDNLQLTLNNQQGNITYQWSGPNSFASFVPSPIIYNIGLLSGGTYTITSTLNGCITKASTVVRINNGGGGKNEIILYPNPNNGNFSVIADLERDQIMPFEIVNSVGMIVYSSEAYSSNLQLFTQVSIRDLLASGVYIFRIQIGGSTKEIPFTIVR